MPTEVPTRRLRGKDVNPPNDPALPGDIKRLIEILKEDSRRTCGADDSEPPRVLAGRYRLIRPIGEGGFGQVWEAFDDVLRRAVAIKIPRPGSRLTEAEIESFSNEARRAGLMRHHGIVAVHDFGRCEEGCFIVSDLVNGTDLRRHLLSGAFPVEAALRVVAQVAEALHHAHQQGFVHRDVKPGNILIDGSGRVFVTDFGIAATAEEMRKEGGTRRGTPGYMSPEQHAVEGGAIGARTDIYSLGVVLYQALTGERPFQSECPTILWDQILREAPRPPRSIERGVPKEAERICMTCLEKRPEDRYSTAQELAGELRGVLRKRGRSRWRQAFFMGLAAITVALGCYNALGLRGTPDPKKDLGIFPTEGMVNIGPSPRDLEVDKGIERFWARDYPAAIEHFEAALSLRRSITVLSYKADAHLHLLQFDEAIECCDEVLRAKPDFSKAHFTKGVAYEHMKQPGKAIECFRLAAIHGDPKANNEVRRLMDLLR